MNKVKQKVPKTWKSRIPGCEGLTAPEGSTWVYMNVRYMTDEELEEEAKNAPRFSKSMP